MVLQWAQRQQFLKFKFKFIYSHLFNYNTTTIRNKKEEIIIIIKTELTIHRIKHNKGKECVAAKGAKLSSSVVSSWLLPHSGYKWVEVLYSFANISMAHIETTILSRTVFKPTVWKRYIDDIFSLWDGDISKPDIEAFIEQDRTDTETVFLDTVVYKGTRFKEKSILDVKTHFKKRKPSSTHISPLVTRRVLKKDLSKEKP